MSENAISMTNEGNITVPFTVTIPLELYNELIKDQALLLTIRSAAEVFRYDYDITKMVKAVLGIKPSDDDE